MENFKRVFWVALLSTALLLPLAACQENPTQPELADDAKSSQKEDAEQDSDQSEQNAAEKQQDSAKKEEEAKEIAAYHEACAEFERMKMADVRKKQEAGEEFYLYIGAETCPFCVKFAPILRELQIEKDFKVGYLDSDAYNDDDLQTFIEEQKLETIPALFRIKDKEVEHLKFKAPYSQAKLSKIMGLD